MNRNFTPKIGNDFVMMPENYPARIVSTDYLGDVILAIVKTNLSVNSEKVMQFNSKGVNGSTYLINKPVELRMI